MRGSGRICGIRLRYDGRGLDSFVVRGGAESVVEVSVSDLPKTSARRRKKKADSSDDDCDFIAACSRRARAKVDRKASVAASNVATEPDVVMPLEDEASLNPGVLESWLEELIQADHGGPIEELLGLVEEGVCVCHKQYVSHKSSGVRVGGRVGGWPSSLLSPHTSPRPHATPSPT